MRTNLPEFLNPRNGRKPMITTSLVQIRSISAIVQDNKRTYTPHCPSPTPNPPIFSGLLPQTKGRKQRLINQGKISTKFRFPPAVVWGRQIGVFWCRRCSTVHPRYDCTLSKTKTKWGVYSTLSSSIKKDAGWFQNSFSSVPDLAPKSRKPPTTTSYSQRRVTLLLSPLPFFAFLWDLVTAPASTGTFEDAPHRRIIPLPPPPPPLPPHPPIPLLRDQLHIQSSAPQPSGREEVQRDIDLG